MKLVLGLFITGLAVVSIAAQDATTEVEKTRQAKVVAELSGTHVSQVKNSPFTADEVSESVQTLADGNRIVRTSTGKMYRNSEGRIRRESKGGIGGAAGFAYTIGSGVSIVDPLIRQKVELDSALKTARVYDMKSSDGNVTIVSDDLIANKKRAEELIEKLKAEGKLGTVADSRSAEEMIAKLKAEGKLDNVTVVTGDAAGVYRGTLTGTAGSDLGRVISLKPRYETRKEELGTRDIEGVSAEGIRTITTIPAGAIGNERPIEVVYERWYSKELGLTVYSKTTDPRFGEQTYKLTNIVRSEPDPSLFTVPTEYRKVGGQGGFYRVTPSVVAAKPAPSPTAKAVVKPQ